MTKRQLIDEITMRNPTARAEFLARFEEADLGAYLDHLIVSRRPRLSGGSDRYAKYFRSDRRPLTESAAFGKYQSFQPAEPVVAQLVEVSAPAQSAPLEPREPVKITQPALFVPPQELEATSEPVVPAPAEVAAVAAELMAEPPPVCEETATEVESRDELAEMGGLQSFQDNDEAPVAEEPAVQQEVERELEPEAQPELEPEIVATTQPVVDATTETQANAPVEPESQAEVEVVAAEQPAAAEPVVEPQIEIQAPAEASAESRTEQVVEAAEPQATDVPTTEAVAQPPAETQVLNEVPPQAVDAPAPVMIEEPLAKTEVLAEAIPQADEEPQPQPVAVAPESDVRECRRSRRASGAGAAKQETRRQDPSEQAPRGEVAQTARRP